jgi:hypothetical protein
MNLSLTGKCALVTGANGGLVDCNIDIRSMI